ncbi:MAG: DinB family protein [Vicinamibacterales bacterium]
MSTRPRATSLADLRAQFAQITSRVSTLFGTMDAARFTTRPTPQSWSAAECLAHLNLSVDPYFAAWADALARAPRAETDRYTLDLWGRLLVWTLEPPPRFRVPTSANFQPVRIEHPDTVVPAFVSRQEAILRTIDAARGVAIDKIKIVSPFERRVRYSIWSSFCVTAAHERRHLWQAERAAGVSPG